MQTETIEWKEPKKEFLHWKITWRFGEEGRLQESDFYLPYGELPEDHIGDLENIVELSADEYGYEYQLILIDDRTGETWVYYGQDSYAEKEEPTDNYALETENEGAYAPGEEYDSDEPKRRQGLSSGTMRVHEGDDEDHRWVDFES